MCSGGLKPYFIARLEKLWSHQHFAKPGRGALDDTPAIEGCPVDCIDDLRRYELQPFVMSCFKVSVVLKEYILPRRVAGRGSDDLPSNGEGFRPPVYQKAGGLFINRLYIHQVITQYFQSFNRISSRRTANIFSYTCPRSVASKTRSPTLRSLG